MAIFKLTSTCPIPLVTVGRDWKGSIFSMDQSGQNILVISGPPNTNSILPVSSAFNDPVHMYEVGYSLRKAARSEYEPETHLVEVTLPDGNVRRTLFACPHRVTPRVGLLDE